MEYILLATLVVLVVLGPSQSALLAADLTSIEKRRNLLLRLVGFGLLSAWLHLLPSMLLLIYMKHYGFFAPEVFGGDSSRAVVISIYLAPSILMGAIYLSVPALAVRLGARKLQVAVIGSIVFVTFAALLYKVAGSDRLALTVLLGIVTVAVAVHLSLALSGSITVQIRLWFIPFVLMASVSTAMFYYSEPLSEIVGRQLMSFGSGGGLGVVMERGGKFYSGRLLLTTTDATYIHLQPLRDGMGNIQCVMRIPLSDSVMTVNNGIAPKDAIQSC